QDLLATNEANERLQDALASIDISISADYLVQQGAVFWGSTLTVPIPVFNRNQGERQKASVRTMQSQKQIEALEQQVDDDVETAYREFTTRQMIVHKMQDSILTRAKEVRSSVEYAYKTGGTTILDFLDAEREYRDAVKSYNDALVALQKSAFTLRAAMGQIN
ncbi:MAG TPA: TolC family protein, partial [Candidatus Kapabacteria bacterium]|nr:TolC family protein [Candidatus Kapabacteria bacterium]